MFGRATQESTAVSLYTLARTRLGEIASESRTVRLTRSVFAPPADHTAGSVTTEGNTSSAGPLQKASQDSTVAAIAGTCRRYIEASWLYRWLTAEPDPDVIVIDLRETWTVGPVLVAIERLLRWLVPAAATSWTARIARRSHGVAKARPIQLLSVAVGAATLAALVTNLRGGPPSVLFAVAVAVFLFLSLAGSRITWTWAQLRETRGYQTLAAAFEPPEPPGPREERTGTGPAEQEAVVEEEQTDDQRRE